MGARGEDCGRVPEQDVVSDCKRPVHRNGADLSGAGRPASTLLMRLASYNTYLSGSAMRRASHWSWPLEAKQVGRVPGRHICTLPDTTLRHQLHHCGNRRPPLPHPRILRPQRRPPLLPHSLSRPTSSRHTTRVDSLYPHPVRTDWRTAIIPSPHQPPAQRPPPHNNGLTWHLL